MIKRCANVQPTRANQSCPRQTHRLPLLCKAKQLAVLNTNQEPELLAAERNEIDLVWKVPRILSWVTNLPKGLLWPKMHQKQSTLGHLANSPNLMQAQKRHSVPFLLPNQMGRILHTCPRSLQIRSNLRPLVALVLNDPRGMQRNPKERCQQTKAPKRLPLKTPQPTERLCQFRMMTTKTIAIFLSRLFTVGMAWALPAKDTAAISCRK